MTIWVHLRRYCATAHENGFELSSYSGLELTAASLLEPHVSVEAPWTSHYSININLPSQNARILRRSSFGASRLNYLLICYPYYVHSELIERSGLQRAGFESMVNCIFYEI